MSRVCHRPSAHRRELQNRERQQAGVSTFLVLSCKTKLMIRLLFPLLLLASAAFAAEPIVGTWKLESQTVNGQKRDFEEMTLRVYPTGDSYEFAYSVPVNKIHFVSQRFVKVHFNGTDADVQDVKNNKVGTVKITKGAPTKTGTEYRMVISGPNHPTGESTLTVSADGKKLTAESTATVPNQGQMTSLQVYSRL